jgi:hypothetical protein
MSNRRYDAMKHAVDLARTGRYNNWWSVAARLRTKKYRAADVEWTRPQRDWLDRLCGEARSGSSAPDRRSLGPEARSSNVHRPLVMFDARAAGAAVTPMTEYRR